MLEADETYQFEIDAVDGASDLLAVRKLEPQTAVTVLDLNDSSVELVLRAGMPSLGDTFRLLSADRIKGSFEDLIAPPLASQLRWDFSRLYLDGSVAVAAIPEPRSSVLLLAAALLAAPTTRSVAHQSGS
jgi:hypothetical protein